MSQIARETDLGRESLYKAMPPNGNPKFSSVLEIMRALGLRLRATADAKEVSIHCYQADDVEKENRGGSKNTRATSIQG